MDHAETVLKSPISCYMFCFRYLSAERARTRWKSAGHAANPKLGELDEDEEDFLSARLPDGDSQILRLYAFGPSGFWTMAPLRCAAKFDPFLSLDCARVEGVGAQSKERTGSNFAA